MHAFEVKERDIKALAYFENEVLPPSAVFPQGLRQRLRTSEQETHGLILGGEESDCSAEDFASHGAPNITESDAVGLMRQPEGRLSPHSPDISGVTEEQKPIETQQFRKLKNTQAIIMIPH